MLDFLLTAYPWVKSLHVMAVISWMAGLFYLPRLFVYQSERARDGAEPGDTLVMMQEKLLRVIMNPALIVTWLAGLTLVLTPGIVDWGSIWPWTKAAGVLAMTGFHMWCAGERRRLEQGHARAGRTYRLLNEAPTLLMVVIVLSVIVKF